MSVSAFPHWLRPPSSALRPRGPWSVVPWSVVSGLAVLRSYFRISLTPLQLRLRHAAREVA